MVRLSEARPGERRAATRRSAWWAGGAIAAAMVWAVAQGGFPGPFSTAGRQNAAASPAATTTPLASPERSGGEIVFEDNFEGGRMDRWKIQSATTPL